ncbi:MAG: hypothetical protein IJV31_04690 [Clostridia bacterium]|nr:hypothetical protein [Clostridia bacterium]
MEETIIRLKNVFGNEATGIKTLETRIAFAVGYMRDNDSLSRKDALEIIRKIVTEEL